MKYGFIGCGNMGGAIAKALSRKVKNFLITDKTGKAIPLAAELGCTYTDTASLCKHADAIFLAVKPNVLKSVLSPIIPLLAEKKPLIISIIAGVEIRQLENMIGASLPIIRLLPNTPVTVGKGLIQYCYNDLVSYGQLNDLLEDLSMAGALDPISEELMDAASAVSGCGPAFIYTVIDALADGAVACGVPREKAIQYAAATVVGAGEMVLRTDLHPGALKDAVCSPGGSTIQGIRVLEERGVRGAIMDAVISSCEKNQKLGD